MMPRDPSIPDWHWGTSEGSREFDRLLDRQMTFREKLQWLEEMESLSLAMEAARRDGSAAASPDSKRSD